MERGGGGPLPISFSPVTSTNVEISSQNFLNFGFNPFATLPPCCRQSQSQISELGTKTTTPKNVVFLVISCPCKIEVFITSLIEMLELPFATLPSCCRQSQSQISELGTKTTPPKKMWFFWSNPVLVKLRFLQLLSLKCQSYQTLVT